MLKHLCDRSVLSEFGGKDTLFFIAYGMWLFSAMISASMLEPHFIFIRRLFTYGSMVLVILYELKHGRWSNRELVGLIVIAIFGVSFINASTMAMLQAAILIYCGRRVDFYQILRFSLIMTSALLAFVVACALIGLIQNYVSSDEVRTRFFLGFRYVLYPSELLFAITCMVVVLRKGNLFLSDVAILVGANVFIFILTQSRLAFISALAVVIGVLVLRVFKGFKEAKSSALDLLFASAFFGSAVLSIGISIAFDPGIAWMAYLDKTHILTGRLAMGKMAFTDYGVSLFGQAVSMNGMSVDGFGYRDNTQPYFYIDNLYVQLIVRFGLVPMLVLIILMTAATHKAWKAGDSCLAFVFFVIALHSIIQDYMVLLVYNPFLFVLGGLALGNESRRFSGRRIALVCE